MAITKDLFRSLIKEGQEDIISVELYDRPFDFELNGRYVLVGVRQAGKSYMLFKRAKQLIAEGAPLQQIVYINFDDERLIGMTANELDLILQAYFSVCSHEPFFFFDEIQNVDGWEHFARRLANKKYRVFITGSNARMLSRDIQTTLGGRYLDAQIFPYSFQEFLGANSVELDADWLSGKKQASAVQRLMETYLKWGGFPELLLFSNKRKWLNDLYEKILLGDVILRNNVKNEMSLRLVMKRLAENVMQPTSYRRLAHLIVSAGYTLAVSSVSDYVRYATDACVIFSMENYASKFVEKETVKKHYFVDNGLLSIFLNGGESLLLENVCAVHLRRIYGNEVCFYNKEVEVDFFVPDLGYAVQVAWSVYGSNAQGTLEREVEALGRLNALQGGLRRMVIVTRDEQGEEVLADGSRVEVVPVWQWLLEG